MTPPKIRLAKPAFVHCPCCELYHPNAFTGDCRDDANRFAADELDALFGSTGWDQCATAGGGSKGWGGVP